MALPPSPSRLVRARKRLVREVNRWIAPLETLGARPPARLGHRPVFVIGSPRSGTTLLSQVIINLYDVGYFSNLHNAVWGAPSWVARMLRPLSLPPNGEFRSHLGNTMPWLGLSEAPSYWLRFLPENPYCVRTDEVSRRDLQRMRNAVGRLIEAVGKPVLFKTIANTGRLGPIAAALPEARFVVCRRSPLDAAHSLLEARWKVHESFEPWWSFEPRDVDALRVLPPHEQVLEQVLAAYDQIDRDRAEIGAERFLDVEYEKLCDDPRSTVAPLASFAGLSPRLEGEVPLRFERRNEIRVPTDVHDALVRFWEQRRGPSSRQRNPGGPGWFSKRDENARILQCPQCPTPH